MKLNRKHVAELSQISLGDLAVALEIAQAYRRPAVEMGTCPHCDHYGPVEEDFGFRTIRGKVIRQSWCRTCRASPDSHPRRK